MGTSEVREEFSRITPTESWINTVKEGAITLQTSEWKYHQISASHGFVFFLDFAVTIQHHALCWLQFFWEIQGMRMYSVLTLFEGKICRVPHGAFQWRMELPHTSPPWPHLWICAWTPRDWVVVWPLGQPLQLHAAAGELLIEQGCAWDSWTHNPVQTEHCIPS